MYIDADIGIRELDSRTNDGIAVTLFWDSATDRPFVVVDDEREGHSFSLDVEPSDVLYAFHHPFAYASSATS